MAEFSSDPTTYLRREILDLEPCVHGARLRESSKHAGIIESELLDLSSSINPLQIDLGEPLGEACKSIDRYPDSDYADFCSAAADFVGVSHENIIPGNGSTELIRLFAETVISHGDRVLIPTPTFGEYESQSKLMGASIIHRDFDRVLTTTEDELSSMKAVFLCNPNNPTGNLLEARVVRDLIKKCTDAGVFLFVDEAFIDLSNPECSVVQDVLDCDFLFVLRSLTKSFGVAGLRIGFGVAHETLAGFMNRVRLTWNLNIVGERVGKWLFENASGFLEESRAFIRSERKWFFVQLANMHGFKPIASKVNFILIDISGFSLGPKELSEKLLEKGIMIRDCASFGLPNHIRVAVRKRDENLRFIHSVEEVAMEWGREMGMEALQTAIEEGDVERSRVACEYYPCHFEGQDCTFCFCPFYPCEDTRTGGEYITRASGSKVWSCMKCDLPHRPEVAKRLLDEFLKGTDLKKTWERVMEPLL